MAIDTTAAWDEMPIVPSTKNQINPQTLAMNKLKLIESVQKDLGGTKAGAERAVNAVIDGIKSHIRKSKIMQLVGFGTFRVVNRKARTGINPKTRQPIKIKASKSVKFGASKDLKSKL